MAATGCLVGNKPPLPPLSPRALKLLRDRWAAANPIPALEADECYFSVRPITGYATARTSRGDVVTLAQSHCGYLVLEGPLGGSEAPYAVHVTFEELGLADELARQIQAYAQGPVP